MIDNLARATLSVSGPYRLEVVHMSGRPGAVDGQQAVSVEASPTDRGVRLGQDETAEATVTPRVGTVLGLTCVGESGREETREFPCALTFRRLMVNAALFGNRDAHFVRFVDAALAA